ncbi:MAG TPA: cysteine desulfurase family protein [Xanthobacteraceae bacterium]|nr:cysteine desulfurase family protein [Xanthobacteraceae bacterium]
MNERIYLDWNATAPLREEARTAALASLDLVGNPSSVHREGRAARHVIEQAREQVAALVGAAPRNVVFTSGGTEANVLALVPTAARDRLLVSAIEHPSVLAGGRFPAGSVEHLPVTGSGEVDLAALERRVAALEGRALVSLMLANNETGVVQPVSQAASVVHAAGGTLHVDAVQAAGRIPCDINALDADLLTLSGHKIGAPKGIGALVGRAPVDPLVKGGGQERGLRGGTENVAGIAGFGAAAAAARGGLASARGRMAALRDRLEAGLKGTSPQMIIFGAQSERLPNTTLFAVPGMKAETAVIAFDLAGVAVSAGSACSSGKVQPSHVLAAMGVPPQLATAAVRVSLGPGTTESEIERFIEAWINVSGSLLRRSEGMAA